MVEAFRGSNVGYRLARPADGISLFEIVEAMEGPLGMTECSVHVGRCGIEDSCNVRANWRRINDVVADALCDVSLAQRRASEEQRGVCIGGVRTFSSWRTPEKEQQNNHKRR